MRLPTRRSTSIIICAFFALLVFVGLSREFMPTGWSFRRLKWQTSTTSSTKAPGAAIDAALGTDAGAGVGAAGPVIADGKQQQQQQQQQQQHDAGVPPQMVPPQEQQEQQPPSNQYESDEQQSMVAIVPSATSAMENVVDSTPKPTLSEDGSENPPEVTEKPEEPVEPATPHVIDPTRWLDSIRDFFSTGLKPLSCPRPDYKRYEYLRTLHRMTDTPEDLPPFKPYFFALNLHQSIHILPRLLGSLVEVMRVLGPENCVLSIVEGRSTDGTYEVLEQLDRSLPEGVKYYFSHSEIDPTTSGRIGSLAELRNLAIQPLIDHREMFSADNTTVIFFNDVAACPDDVLELVHQRFIQAADMTCAMDWNYVDYSGHYRLTFYDVWIARSMSGQSFFHIPFGGSWNESMHLFWSDTDADRLAKARWERGLTFQVFSCWNGGVAFTAAPILHDGVRFRLNRDDECYQGEVSLFTKDLWLHNYSRIAVVPSVNLAYDDDTARRIHAEKGLPSRWIARASREAAAAVPWHVEPPDKVLCIPDWVRQPQYWVDWNE